MDDQIVVKEQVKTLHDLVSESGDQKKQILIQKREPSHTLLLGLSAALGIEPSKLQTSDEGAAKAIERFKSNDDIWAAGSYPPYTNGLRTWETVSSAKAKYPEFIVDVTDIMVVRESYLASNRDTVEKLLSAWFEVVEILIDPQSPRHEEAMELAAKFVEDYDNPGYGVEEFKTDMTGIILADEKANFDFFSQDQDGNTHFRGDLERARVLYNQFGTVKIEKFDPSADRSDILLDYLKRRAAK